MQLAEPAAHGGDVEAREVPRRGADIADQRCDVGEPERTAVLAAVDDLQPVRGDLRRRRGEVPLCVRAEETHQRAHRPGLVMADLLADEHPSGAQHTPYLGGVEGLVPVQDHAKLASAKDSPTPL